MLFDLCILFGWFVKTEIKYSWLLKRKEALCYRLVDYLCSGTYIWINNNTFNLTINTSVFSYNYNDILARMLNHRKL